MGRDTTESPRRRRDLGWWLYQPYKVLVFTPILVVSTLFFGSMTIVLSVFLDPRRVSLFCGALWAKINGLATPMLVKVDGRERIDPHQSYVIVSNHQSHYDVFALYGWLGVDFKWVMKQELRKVPGLGIGCEKVGHIFIDRSNHEAAVASINAAKAKVVDGTSVIFFAEGTRSRDGRLGGFKKGAFRFALDLGLPILPVTLVGTRELLPPDTTDLRPGRVRMVIHPPVPTVGLGEEDVPELIERVRGIISGPLGTAPLEVSAR